jgi:signal transduction protein with GAF and PtsI domain
LLLDDTVDVPLILVAHDLSPADMLQFKQSVFAGFITDVGGKTSHTAIVARSLDIPAVVGARLSSHLIQQDDWVVIDGDAGVVVVDPSPIILAEYGFKQRQVELQRGRPREALRWFEAERRTLGYRGGLDFRRGQVAQAEGDLRRAQALYRRELRRGSVPEVRDSLDAVTRRLGG